MVFKTSVEFTDITQQVMHRPSQLSMFMSSLICLSGRQEPLFRHFRIRTRNSQKSLDQESKFCPNFNSQILPHCQDFNWLENVDPCPNGLGNHFIAVISSDQILVWACSRGPRKVKSVVNTHFDIFAPQIEVTQYIYSTSIIFNSRHNLHNYIQSSPPKFFIIREILKLYLQHDLYFL